MAPRRSFIICDDAQEVRADAVHLVDERDARDAVLVHLAPDGFRLRLDTADGAEQRHGTVQHAQRPLHLGGEIDVTRRVDDVDPVIVPETGRRSGRDRDAALLLLLHPVHRRSAVVHFTHPVENAGVEQDALRRRRLAGVDVRADADVPGSFKWILSWHTLRSRYSQSLR